ncbi:MAG: hypothetical protein ACREQ1_08110 [Woeseiaceae bacterium]
MDLGNEALFILIVGCEAAFWVVLFSGLAARYVFQWRRLSWVLLLCVPLIDLALLAFTVMDLNRGAGATFAHGLATAYVAFTVAFGSAMIHWADQRFAHRFRRRPATLEAAISRLGQCSLRAEPVGTPYPRNVHHLHPAGCHDRLRGSTG